MNDSGVILLKKNNKYFLLNINEEIKKDKRENKVFEWIEQKKFAPIYYDKWTMEQIRNGKDRSGEHKLGKRQHSEACCFLKTFEDISDDNIVFSIGIENIYFFQQKSQLEERKYKKWLIKGFYIKNPKTIPIRYCPLVLANIKANRYLSSGTFIPLEDKEDKNKYFGNIKAIEYLLAGGKLDETKQNDKKVVLNNFTEYLKCLSSVEFETLIAKILEEKGFFVSAYRGGCMKDIDLFCRHSKEKPINLGEKNEVERDETKLIQIKLELEEDDHKKGVADFYFCIKSKIGEKNNVFEAKDIRDLLKKSKTIDWLKESLKWTKCEELNCLS